MIEIDFRHDAAVQRLRALQRDVYEKVMVRALNRTATTVRSEAARLMKKEIGAGVKVGEIRKSIRIIRANPVTLVAIVRPSGRKRIPLTAFGARQTRAGVTVRIGGRTVRIPGAWIRQPRGWNREAVRVRAPSFKAQLYTAIDTRRKRVPEYRGRPDFPIAEVMAPGLPTIFVQTNVMDALKRTARERFARVIAQEIKFRGL